jgi:DNA-binding transcriptional MerR regulator
VGAQAIPQKLYYRIGEVADIAGVKPHVLRYWETEFGFLSPQKNEGNQRLYTPKDLEKVLLIRKLLYEDRFTIAGAKRKLREERKSAGAAMRSVRLNQLLDQIKGEAQALTRLLNDAAETQ